MPLRAVRPAEGQALAQTGQFPLPGGFDDILLFHQKQRPDHVRPPLKNGSRMLMPSTLPLRQSSEKKSPQISGL